MKLTEENLRLWHEKLINKLTALNYSNNTKRHYLSQFGVFLSYWIDEFPDKELSDDIVHGYIQSRDSSLRRGFMRMFLKVLNRDDLTLPEKPRGRKKRRLPKYPTYGEIIEIMKYLMDQAVEDRKKFWHLLLFCLIYDGALRRSEILSIKFGSFNWQEWKNEKKSCYLKVVGKGNKEREVVISRDTILFLYAWICDQTDNPYKTLRQLNDVYLFDNSVVKITDAMIYKIITHASLRAIGRKVSPHQIRHARASKILEDGGSVMAIKEYLGHSSLEVTEVYLHRKQREGVNEVRRLTDSS